MKLLGYSSKFSVQPNDSIAFHISSEFATYTARIVRLIHGDDRPGSPGFKSEHVAGTLDGAYAGEVQALHRGSYVHIPYAEGLNLNEDFSAELWIWPTMPDQAKGVLLSQGGEGGFILSLEAGHLTFEAGPHKLALEAKVVARTWYRVTVAFSYTLGSISLVLAPHVVSGSVPGGDVSKPLPYAFGSNGDVVIGAQLDFAAAGRLAPSNIFNGKIDGPKIYRSATAAIDGGDAANLVAAWDFSKGIDTWDITDVSGNGHNGKAINQPMRGATGHNWDGRETSWKHATDQYGAIHFHDDDQGDADWKISLEWTVPEGLRSGVYALHVSPGAGSNGTDDDYIPFFVRPLKGKRSSEIALLMPTFTYMAYGNERILESGGVDPEASYAVQKEDRFIVDNRLLSLYDIHSDGSAVCYSSRLRPILNMRPRVVMQYLAFGKGSPHGLNADLYLTDWLERFGFEYDVLTDEDLHKEGVGLLSGYKAVLIPTHSEYWSLAMIEGAQSYLRDGGRMLHLSGNGMYWVTQLHPASDASIEVRRGGRCVGLSSPEPGEEYLSCTGELGGIWTYRGHAPQTWLGIGSTAETPGLGRPYERQPDSFDPRASFVFEGVGAEELIGDFPNLIQEYGAAGYEIDCADTTLGTSPSALILATAKDFSNDAQVFAERISYMDLLQGRPVSHLVKADMALLDYPNGGAVFAVGSIAWCGALSYNNYENNVSRVTLNVLNYFIASNTDGV
jgi:N,N-dimethylformamidase